MIIGLYAAWFGVTFIFGWILLPLLAHEVLLHLAIKNGARVCLNCPRAAAPDENSTNCSICQQLFETDSFVDMQPMPEELDETLEPGMITLRSLVSMPRDQRRDLSRLALACVPRPLKYKWIFALLCFGLTLPVFLSVSIVRPTVFSIVTLIVVGWTAYTILLREFPTSFRRALNLAAERIDADDIACLACGYPRRGLPPDAPCPECSRDVVPERYGSQADLFWASPRHQRRLLDQCAPRVAIDAFMNLTSEQRSRVKDRHFLSSYAGFDYYLFLIVGTILTTLVGGAIAYPFMANLFNDIRSVGKLISISLFISFLVVTIPVFVYLRSKLYLGVVRLTLPAFCRAINHTLDTTCPVCEHERGFPSETPCSRCACPPIPEFAASLIPRTPLQTPESPLISKVSENP